MKLVINLSLSILALLTLGEKLYSLSNYQIKKICEKNKREISCIKKMQEKRSNLQKGNYIEIPVIPYRGK